jgi:hypothetical protein
MPYPVNTDAALINTSVIALLDRIMVVKDRYFTPAARGRT